MSEMEQKSAKEVRGPLNLWKTLQKRCDMFLFVLISLATGQCKKKKVFVFATAEMEIWRLTKSWIFMNEMKRCFSLFAIGRVPPKKTILNACGIQESITTASIRGYPKFVWCTSFSGTVFKKQLGCIQSFYLSTWKKTVSKFRSTFNTASSKYWFQ